MKIRSVPSVWFRSLSVIIVMTIMTVMTGLLPAQDVGASENLAALMSRAERAVGGSQWEDACDYFEQALRLAQGGDLTSISEKLMLCRAHVSIEKRYGDGTVSQHIKKMPFEQGCRMARDIWSALSSQYYHKFDSKILRQAVLQMKLVLDEQAIRQQYNCEAQSVDLLEQKLGEIQLELAKNQEYSYDRLYYRLTGLSVVSEKAGLGASWPMVEMAYALSGSLDRYSYLMSPVQYNRMYDQLLGHYQGVGIDLIFSDAYPFVYDVTPDSPADKCGILPGDYLQKVDGTDLEGKSAQETRKLLAGKSGSSVLLTMIRRERPSSSFKILTVEANRGRIEAKTVRNVRVLSKNIGYFRVTSFDFDTAWQMRVAVEQLKRKGIEVLTIDLRNNGGGVLDAAVDASRLFLDEGLIVSVQSRKERVNYRAGGDNFVCFTMPVILLTNKNTASASELFAAALRDHHRALLVGEQTFGKGVVQTVVPLKGYGCGLCITTANYIPPSGIGFDGVGLKPDLPVKMHVNNPETTLSALDMISLKDPVVQMAIRHSMQGL